MPTDLHQLQEWIAEPENETIEFKEAKNQIDSKRLGQYCSALANEGGGKLILGVTNNKPRTVVGSEAFDEDTLRNKRQRLYEELGIRIETEIIDHPDGPVIVFYIPSRPVGATVKYKDIAWMRVGEQLHPMSDDRLRAIFEEGKPDWSAEICDDASLSDLDTNAIDTFRSRWIEKSGKQRLADLSVQQLLKDAELITEEGITYAALILFGKEEALGRLVPQAEVIFEYRSAEEQSQYEDRRNYRSGVFIFVDELWATINARNPVQQIQDGLFRRDIAAYDESVVREMLLNALAHRDYRQEHRSIFVRQSSESIVVESPGGLPPPVTLENILDNCVWRNRRIAETLEKCGLVERSGQGIDLIYERCIRQGKEPPSFEGTEADTVRITVNAAVQNPAFLKFLEQVSQEQQTSLVLGNLLVLDAVCREREIPEKQRDRLNELVDRGVIERVGHGRGTKYILSSKYYDIAGEPGTYTRKKGLDRETCKRLLLKHIEKHATEGSPLRDLQDVLPDKTYDEVRFMVYELRDERRIRKEGRTRAARWYPVAANNGNI